MVHPSPVQDSPRLIAGRYRIDGPLAEGGMALVFRGWHVLLEQPIAIKVLKDEYSEMPEAVARFLREARATARLRGRHVAHVFDIGKVEGRTPFMVTELLKGADLGRLLAAGAFSVERAVATLVAVCDAVLEVHAAGIVHRDLKPDNLFLVLGTGDPHVKILDFGVAKPLHPGPHLTLPERGVGSPHYMSPEQIMTPLDVDFRSDVWSLGVVLFELLTARMPFSGATIPELCAAIVRSDVPPPSRLRAMPAALEQVIYKCLQKDRAVRFQDVASLRQALIAVQAGLTAEELPADDLPPEAGSAQERSAETRLSVRRSRAMLLLASFVACVVSFALTLAAVILLFDTAPAPAPHATPVPTGLQQQSGTSLKPPAPLPEPPASLRAALLCDTGEYPAAGELASGVTGCRSDVPDTARAAHGTRRATAAGGEQKARVPSRVQLPRAIPEPLESWLWLERDSGALQSKDHDVIDPYADEPYTRR